MSVNFVMNFLTVCCNTSSCLICLKLIDVEFYILLTVHIGMILVNNQLDTQFFFYTFISILYMFRVTPCSSSGDSIVSIRHLVYVTLCRWPSGMQFGKDFLPDLHTRWSPTVAYPGILFGGGFNKFSWGQRTERTGIWVR